MRGGSHAAGAFDRKHVGTCTGTIARTCAATGVGLHLVGPLGFEIDNSRLKRAGLDYWPFVTVKEHTSWQVSTLSGC